MAQTGTVVGAAQLSPLLQSLLPVVAGFFMLWAAVVALAGEAVGDLRSEMLSQSGGRSLAPERVLHVMHFALLTLAAATAGTATGWWAFETLPALGRVVLVVSLVWAVGDLVPRLLGVLAPEMVPHARRVALGTAPLFAPLLWMARRLDHGNGGEATAQLAQPGANTSTMAAGVFSLKEMTVSEVMTPRIDIIAVHHDSTEEQLVAILRSSEHARLLVDDGNIDQVAGVIYAKDVLPRLGINQDDREPWQSLMRPASYVPEAKTLERQLRAFQRGPAHIAVVVDEYGGTAGLVTLEDIVEQIVGEIQDEYDVDEVDPVTRHPDGRLTVEGGVALADLEAELEHEFDREDIATVGGLVLAEFGRVPRIGERFTLDGWQFVAELVVRRRIRRVMVTRVGETDPSEGGA